PLSHPNLHSFPTRRSSDLSTTVTISGTHFAGASVIKFGSFIGTIVSVSDTQISAKSPQGAAGPVDIFITTPSGTSLANAPNDQLDRKSTRLNSSHVAISYA